MHPEQHKIDAAMQAIGATREDILQIARTSKSVPEARARLDELKVQAKRRAKQLALELHPDRTGNDPEKMEQLQFIHRVLGELMQLKVREAPPPRPVFRHWPVVVTTPSGWADSTTAGAVNTGTFWCNMGTVANSAASAVTSSFIRFR